MADSWFRKLLGSPDRSGRRRVPAAPAGPTRPTAASRTNAYQAVGILAGGGACAAVAKAKGQRFLARQAPRLPLPDCDRAAECRCRFEKYVDRRSRMQRSPYNDAGVVSFGGVEQRINRGRRGTDR